MVWLFVVAGVLLVGSVFFIFSKAFDRLYQRYMLKRLKRQFEALYENANGLRSFVSESKVAEWVSYYERLLLLIEGYLELTYETLLDDFNEEFVQTSLLYSAELSRRLKGMKKGIKAELQGKPFHGIQGFVTNKNSWYVDFCYFCSKPVKKNFNPLSKVVVQDRILQVKSCAVCRHKLQTKQKVNVLYFFIGDDQVHWTQFDEYIPSYEFFYVNALQKLEKQNRESKLKLVVPEKPQQTSPE